MDLLVALAVMEWLSCIITPCDFGDDRFGVDTIYPTVPGGRQWFIDMNDPGSDGVFDPRAFLARNPDGSWRVSGEDNGKYQVRMNVGTPPGLQEWKNVEITGYVRVVDSLPPFQDHNALTWYARGGEHTIHAPCDGTSLKGRLHVGGSVDWLKEIWHAGGYTAPLGQVQVVDPIVGKWVGWKVAIYNINNGTAVRMESYIDAKADNNWTKVADVVDRGAWYTNSINFHNVDCGKPRNYVITDSGPIATFRSDNIVWDFKSLSVREIAPPADRLYSDP